MRGERVDVAQCRIEVTTEADGPVVDEHMRRRLAIGHFVDDIVETVRDEPRANVRLVTGCENDNPIAALAQRFEEPARARSRRIEVIGALPPRIRIEYAVQIDADDRLHALFALDVDVRRPAARRVGSIGRAERIGSEPAARGVVGVYRRHVRGGRMTAWSSALRTAAANRSAYAAVERIARRLVQRAGPRMVLCHA